MTVHASTVRVVTARADRTARHYGDLDGHVSSEAWALLDEATDAVHIDGTVCGGDACCGEVEPATVTLTPHTDHTGETRNPLAPASIDRETRDAVDAWVRLDAPQLRTYVDVYGNIVTEGTEYRVTATFTHYGHDTQVRVVKSLRGTGRAVSTIVMVLDRVRPRDMAAMLTVRVD